MVDRQDSEYAPDPSSGDDKEGEGDVYYPDKGEDFSGDIPAVSVDWKEPPSFNDDPPKNGGSDGGNQTIPPVEAFVIDLSSMRVAEQNMLNYATVASMFHFSLRQKIMWKKHGIFGQGATQSSATYTSSSIYEMPQNVGKTEPSQWAEAAEEFAAIINPLQEKALAQIAGVLQSTGEYIATLNAVGQMYAQADRNSLFPDPPASS